MGKQRSSPIPESAPPDAEFFKIALMNGCDTGLAGFLNPRDG